MATNNYLDVYELMESVDGVLTSRWFWRVATPSDFIGGGDYVVDNGDYLSYPTKTKARAAGYRETGLKSYARTFPRKV